MTDIYSHASSQRTNSWPTSIASISERPAKDKVQWNLNQEWPLVNYALLAAGTYREGQGTREKSLHSIIQGSAHQIPRIGSACRATFKSRRL